MSLSYPPDPPTKSSKRRQCRNKTPGATYSLSNWTLLTYHPRRITQFVLNPRRWDWSHEATRWVQSISDAWEEFRQFHGKNLSTLTPTKQQSLPGLLILVVDPNKRSFSTVTAGARSKHIYYIYSYVHVYHSIAVVIHGSAIVHTVSWYILVWVWAN